MLVRFQNLNMEIISRNEENSGTSKFKALRGYTPHQESKRNSIIGPKIRQLVRLAVLRKQRSSLRSLLGIALSTWPP